MLFRLECNIQNIEFNHNETSQPASICRLLPLTNDYEEACTAAFLPNLEIDGEFILNSDTSPLCSSSVKTTPIGGGDMVVRQKMAKNNIHHVTGTRTIIDDIVCCSTSKALALLMLEFMCRVSTTYRALSSCIRVNSFYDRFEYVGHDSMANGNTIAQSKYDLIKQWATPTTGNNLHSFVSLCNYYNKFCPMFQVLVIPLRQLYIKYTRKHIPATMWNPELLDPFESLKVAITSLPVLARHDSSLPTFLKTDRSAVGMGFIIMQPNNDNQSLDALELLRTTGENKFDNIMDGPRLQSILFGHGNTRKPNRITITLLKK